MARAMTSLKRSLARLPRWVYAVAALAFAVIFPLFQEAGMMDMLWLRVGVRVLIYTLLALGLNLVLGETGLLHLGYIAFFAIGAYTTALLASPRFDLHLPIWAILAIAIVLAMFFGFLIGLPTLRLRGDYLAIVTLAFGEITRHTFNNWETLTNGPGGIPGIDKPEMLGFVFDRPIEFYYLFLVLLVLVTILLVNLKDSRVGRAWNALREDEIAADHSGIHGMRVKMLSMVLSSGIAGLAGALFAYYQQFINPTYFLFMQSVIVVCMVVLGGMGSIPGAIVGAVALDTAPEVIRQTFTALPANVTSALPEGMQTFFFEFDRYRMLLFGLVIVIVVIFRPEGLLPNTLWRREAHEEDPRDQERTRQTLFDYEEGKQDLEA